MTATRFGLPEMTVTKADTVSLQQVSRASPRNGNQNRKGVVVVAGRSEDDDHWAHNVGNWRWAVQGVVRLETSA